MSEPRPALVLHITGTSHPLHVALAPQEAEALQESLTELLGSGVAKAVATADGGHFFVNFAHVATAHIEQTRSDTHAYGAPSRGTGFSG